MDKYILDMPCPKCGGTLDTKYIERFGMRRQCMRCGYVMFQKPLDTEEPERKVDND